MADLLGAAKIDIFIRVLEALLSHAKLPQQRSAAL